MSAARDRMTETGFRGAACDWPHLLERAAGHVLRQLARSRELSPAQVAAIVTAALPADVARWLRRRLDELGWLDPAAHIPFDVLDSASCPPDLRAGPRELVRLAVFGVPGEGHRFDAKRREAIYQQRCAEITREMRDLESLSYAASRALGHPEVHADPVLFGMLRSFIAEREAEIRMRVKLPGGEEDDVEAELPATGAKPSEFRLPLRERVQMALSKLQLELEGHLTHYADVGAEDALKRIRELRRRYPGQVEQAVVEQCEEQFQRLIDKRTMFRAQLDELVQQAAEAMQRGDEATGAWVLRRLSAIHKLLPAILPEERLESLREMILRSGEKRDRHEAARQLVERERTVGAEVKRLGAIIHRFHTLSQKSSVNVAVMRQAEAEYLRAVDEVRSHDDEWLADLMIELDCLLEDLHGPRDRAEAQVDTFVSNVRTALHHMQREIESIQKERSGTAKRK
jgi:phage shock protein A